MNHLERVAVIKAIMHVKFPIGTTHDNIFAGSTHLVSALKKLLAEEGIEYNIPVPNEIITYVKSLYSIGQESRSGWSDEQKQELLRLYLYPYSSDVQQLFDELEHS